MLIVVNSSSAFDEINSDTSDSFRWDSFMWHKCVIIGAPVISDRTQSGSSYSLIPLPPTLLASDF